MTISTAPTKIIWVSPKGSNTNSGAETAPLKTIQQAINIATPGTKIMVKAGTYVENVTISGGVNYRLKSLTADKPLEIVSADGPGAAIIKSADTSGLVSTIFSIGMSHMRIEGFHIVGAVSRAQGANDGGPLKVIGNADVTQPSKNVVIENNTFSGTGVSMIKVTKTENAQILNNAFKGVASQNFIDMVTVWDTEVIANDFIGNAWLGITMKCGSQNNTIQHNLFDFANLPGLDTQTAVLVGGVGASRLTRDPLPASFTGFEAKNIAVLDNVIVSDSRYSVMFQGAVESRVEGNLLGASGGTATKSAHAPSPENESDCRDNTIAGNILKDVVQLHEAGEGQSSGYVIQDNAKGDLADVNFDYGRGSLAQAEPNAAPVIDPLAPIAVKEGETARFIVTAKDADGEIPALSVKVTRSDGTMVSAADYVFTDKGDGTASFAWTTDAADAGSYIATIIADDGKAQTLRTLALDVADVPATTSQTLTVRAGGNGTLAEAPQFEVFADGVSLGVRSIQNPVAGAGFDLTNDGLFRDYVFTFAGTAPESVDIRFLNNGMSGSVDRNLFVDYIKLDGSLFEAESAGFFTPDSGNTALGGARESLYVNGVLGFDGLSGAPNSAPVIAPLADLKVKEGAAIAFAVTASDADGEAPALSVKVTRADGAVVSPAKYVFTDKGDGTGAFAWATGEADDGRYVATITADDGEAKTSRSVALEIEEAPVSLIVRAGGNGSAATPPQFEVLADGVSLGIASIENPVASSRFQINDDRLFRDYGFEFEGGLPDKIEIVYFNDGTSEGVNRNLAIDYIELDGRLLEAEEAGFFTPDSGNLSLAGPRQMLYTDGVLAFEGLADLFVL